MLAGAVGLALALASPLASYSLLIFPEMSGALCISYATRHVLAWHNSTWQWLAAGACAAALPWLHYRLASISVVLGLFAFIQHRHTFTRRSAAAVLAPPVVGAAVLVAWFTYLYGHPFPPASNHVPRDSDRPAFAGVSRVLNGLVGTFLDDQWGALIPNPLLALAIACVCPFAFKRRRDATVLAAIVLPYLVLISSFRFWWGVWCPPARFLTDVVLLAAAPLTGSHDYVRGMLAS